MTYLIPTVYVLAAYTFFLLLGDIIELKLFSILLPFLLGFVNLIVVLTVGRKWSRKTLLNCTLIIKYGLIPFYLIGGCLTIAVTILALFPLPLMALFGIVTILFLIFGYGILLGSAPYAIAYLVKSRKEGEYSTILMILSGICQFFFLFDVIVMMALTLKERHLVKTTIGVGIAAGLCILLIAFFLMVGCPILWRADFFQR